MNFDLFSFHWFWEDRIFGISVCAFDNPNGKHRSMFGIHWVERDLKIDLLWIHVVNYCVLWGYKEENPRY